MLLTAALSRFRGLPCSGLALRSLHHPFCLMLQNQPLQDLQRRLAVFLVKLADRLELELQFVVRPALVVLEQQPVGAGGQRNRQLLHHIQRGLGRTCLIALNLCEMHARQIGETLLGQPPFFA